MNKGKLSLALAMALLVAIVAIGVACTERAVAEDGAAAQAKVAKIVFIDLEKCCKCTAGQTAKSWDALQAALAATSAQVPVERWHMDSQAEQAEKYRTMKPMVAMPAVYFLDAAGNLVEMLQGDVTQEQVEKLLQN